MNYSSVSYYYRDVDLEALLLDYVALCPSKCPTVLLLEAEFWPGWIQYVNMCIIQF